MSFRIRPADERDLVKILRIEKECFTDPWSINVFRGAMSEPHTSVFVLLDETEEVAGYSVSDVVLDEGALDNLAVTRTGPGTDAPRPCARRRTKQGRKAILSRGEKEQRKSAQIV